jgi:hypothetical protein
MEALGIGDICGPFIALTVSWSWVCFLGHIEAKSLKKWTFYASFIEFSPSGC